MMAKTAVLLMVVFLAWTGLAAIQNPPVIDASWKSNSLPRSGALPMTGPLDMGGQSITNVGSNTITFVGGVGIGAQGSNIVIKVGGSNNIAVHSGNIQTYEADTPTYYADGITTKKVGTTISVSDWIPFNLVDLYTQYLVSQGASSRGLLDGPGYLFNDQNGILTNQSTNYTFETRWYKNSITSTNIGGETPTNLVSQWKMNDNAGTTVVIDSVGTNNGTAQQNTSALATAGKINGALAFNGSSDYIGFGHNSSMSTGVHTYVFWSNITNNPVNASGLSYILCDQYSLAVYLNQNTGNFESWDWDTSTAKDSGIIATNGWHHLAFIKNPTVENGSFFYVDGLLVSTFTYMSDAIHEGVNGLTIGDESSGIWIAEHRWPLLGVLDDIRIYSSVLSSNAIASIYNSGNGTESTGSGTTIYTTNSMSLACTNKILDFIPTATWMSILTSGSGITTNDVQGYVSPNYGTNWYQATLAPYASIDLSNTLFQGTAVYTNNTTGSNVILKAVTSSNAVTKILGMWGPSN